MAYTPQIKEIILKSLGRQQGPAIDDSTNRAIVRQSANQFAGQEAASAGAANRALAQEQLANRIGLSEDRLAASEQQFGDTLAFNAQRFEDAQDIARQNLERSGQWHDQGLSDSAYRFDTGVNFQRGRMDYGRKAGNLANIISALELGVSGVEAMNERKRSAERKASRDKLIASYKSMGDERNQTTARLLELMRID